MCKREEESARFEQRAHAPFGRRAMELAARPQPETGPARVVAVARRASRYGDIGRFAGRRPHHAQVARSDGLLGSQMENEDLGLMVRHTYLVGSRRSRGRGREEIASSRMRRKGLPVSRNRYTPLGGLSQTTWGTDEPIRAGWERVQRAPNRHPRPDHRPACRASASRITASLPATCNARRARVMPV